MTPFSQAVEVTHTAKFVANVTGVGAENFRYKWTHNGRILKLNNESNLTLVIDYVRIRNRGKYQCHISNIYNDSKKSNIVELNVTGTYVSWILACYVCMRISYIRTDVGLRESAMKNV